MQTQDSKLQGRNAQECPIQSEESTKQAEVSRLLPATSAAAATPTAAAATAAAATTATATKSASAATASKTSGWLGLD